MLPHTRDFTRDGCTVGARLVTYKQLEEHYVCNDCGGQLVTRATRDEQHQETVYQAVCADCGGMDFVSEREYERQLADYPLIVRGLPDELKALFETETETVTAEHAIAELYGC